jgi:hypothetical protein
MEINTGLIAGKGRTGRMSIDSSLRARRTHFHGAAIPGARLLRWRRTIAIVRMHGKRRSARSLT